MHPREVEIERVGRLPARRFTTPAAMQPLYEAHKRFVMSCTVLHADETAVAMLDPGAGKTKRAYIWAYARGEMDAQRGVIYEFCLGRASQNPVAFLGAAPGSHLDEAWSDTLMCDQYAGYDRALDRRVYPHRIAAAAHARRKFDDLAPARWPRKRSDAFFHAALAPGGGARVDAGIEHADVPRLGRLRPRWSCDSLGRPPRATPKCRAEPASTAADARLPSAAATREWIKRVVHRSPTSISGGPRGKTH